MPATQAVPFLDKRNINARIEPGAINQTKLEQDNAVIMMGAVITYSSEIGAKL